MDKIVSRRTLNVGLIAAGAAASMSRAVAQTLSEGGDWFDMIHAHHALIARNFQDIDAARGDPGAAMRLFRRQTYLLTAHSSAEENVIYPAVARANMVPVSDHLYIEQAHAKVLNSNIEVAMKAGQPWRDIQAHLRDAVLHHAMVDEEANDFPRLRAALTADQNQMLTMGYAREFRRVQEL